MKKGYWRRGGGKKEEEGVLVGGLEVGGEIGEGVIVSKCQNICLKCILEDELAVVVLTR